MPRARNGSPGPGRILWSMPELAEVMGWSTRRMRRWLLREEACTKMRDGHYYTSKEQLRIAFPPRAADEVIANLPE